MIWESWYWRYDLKKFAASLRKRRKQKRWPDAALARCEQTIMVGFFYVRKLIESKNLSRDFAHRNVRITAYPSKGRHVHWLNYRKNLDKLFDMDSPRQRSLKLEDVANQLIHSYIFYLITNESGPLEGIVVASDYLRNRELLSIDLTVIIKIFELAAEGEDDQGISVRYDEKRQDYVVRTLRAVSGSRTLKTGF